MEFRARPVTLIRAAQPSAALAALGWLPTHPSLLADLENIEP